MKLRSIEIVEDLTASSRCDEGFLQVARLRLRNSYEGGESQVYRCDVVSRPGSDAVVAVLYDQDADSQIHVLLRDGPRAPIYLRKFKRFVHPDPREYLTIAEVVAGLVETSDAEGEAGLRQRAAIEAHEEAGCQVPLESFQVIGGENFASPGTSDEKVYYCAGPVRLSEMRGAGGDGTVMEEVSRIVRVELGAAIVACRRGEIPDMKTELALLRLCDHLGYLPQLGLFVQQLPEALQGRYRRLGVAGRRPEALGREAPGRDG
ncbi:MAG: NUDIX hydrolase [Myxococcota bacterium]